MKKLIKTLLIICLLISTNAQYILAEVYFDNVSFSFVYNNETFKSKPIYNGILNTYVLYLPYFYNNESLIVNSQISFTLNEYNIKNNDSLTINLNETYNIDYNDEPIQLLALKGDCKNTMFITTKSGNLNNIHANKANKETGKMLLISDGQIEYDGKLEYIKGRGNSTWETYDKKPYNIKLEDKTDLLNMGEAKTYSLLANYIDRSLLKNELMYNLAQDFNSPYAPSIESVDLYINNGYMGVYSLTEKIEVDESRVNINDLEHYNKKLNRDINLDELGSSGDYLDGSEYKNGSMKWVNIKKQVEEYTGGYIIETDLKERYSDELAGFVSKLGVVNVLKEPEHATYKQVKYISDYYNDFEDALYSDDGYNYKGKHYTEYVDIDSFARMFILQEFSKNIDTGLSSSYLVKDIDDKFIVAPIWDMDNALGSWTKRNDIDYHNPYGFSTAISEYYGMPTIFSAAWQHQDFRDYVIELYNNEFKDLVRDYIDNFYLTAKNMLYSTTMNAMRWEFYDMYNSEQILNEVYPIQDFMNARLEFLDNNLNQDYSVIYKSNNGEGLMFNPTVYKQYDTVTIQEPKYTLKNAKFVCWNTMNDGTGIDYYPGDAIELNNNLTLYAKWDKMNFLEILISKLK